MVVMSAATLASIRLQTPTLARTQLRKSDTPSSILALNSFGASLAACFSCSLVVWTGASLLTAKISENTVLNIGYRVIDVYGDVNQEALLNLGIQIWATNIANVVVTVGVALCVAIALRRGGWVLIDYVAVRLWLAAKGRGPLRYERLLEFGRSCHFLIRIGPYWTWTYRPFRDYLAILFENSPRSAEGGSKLASSKLPRETE
jgi:hypothetical protein